MNNIAAILEKAATTGINELFILSTCNRTEIYGFAENARQSDQPALLGNKRRCRAFQTIGLYKTRKRSSSTSFNVAAGLDSQILGDYEIVGQIKAAVKFSKENGFIRNFYGKVGEFRIAIIQSDQE